MLSAAQRRQAKELFAEHLPAPVQVLFFYADAYAPSTAAARALFDELVPLSDGKIRVKAMTGPEGRAEAARYRVEQAPALVLLDEGGRDARIRFYGAPLGYELMVLLEDLIDVSRGATRLSAPARALIRAIDADMVIRVFSSPT